MAGDDISIADLMPAPHLEYFSISPEGVRVLEPYPRLMAWLKRVQERPSVQATGMQAA
jgi:glutathione S-transferase